MNTTVLGLLAETSIHPGSGRSLGVVDLPVAREAATDYPVMVGSALKGALRDRTENGGAERARALADRLFGKPDTAGELLVSDGRLLLLPVRSLTRASMWVTCPQLIERYGRDLRRAGRGTGVAPALVEPGSALVAGEGQLFLEEREFTVSGEPAVELVAALQQLIGHAEVGRRLRERLVVLHDDDFSWFARYGLPVNARNQLDDDSKQSQNLWYEETLPPDTLMYTLVMERRAGALDTLRQLFPEHDRYLQAGGNETVGHGWFAVHPLAAQEVAA